MNVQPVNIQLLLANLHHLSRTEFHRLQREKEKISKQRQLQQEASVAQDHKIASTAPGQEEGSTNEQPSSVVQIDLSTSHHHFKNFHYKPLVDPTLGSIVNLKR